MRHFVGGASLAASSTLAFPFDFAFVYFAILILFPCLHIAHILYIHIHFDIYFHCLTFTVLDFSLYLFLYPLKKTHVSFTLTLPPRMEGIPTFLSS